MNREVGGVGGANKEGERERAWEFFDRLVGAKDRMTVAAFEALTAL